MQPEVSWFGKVLNHSQHAAEMLEEIRGGPLGLLIDGPAAADAPMAVSTIIEPVRDAQMIPADRKHEPGNGNLPSRFVMHVDGVGSFVVLRGRSIKIGSAASSGQPDLGLTVESNVPTVNIEREEADYFLTCDRTIYVNDAAATSKLLANNDRIALSPRCRLKFTLPNAASATAVLETQGARIPGSDARKVILMDREMILAPGSTAHMRADKLNARAVFYVQNGLLLCRTDAEVLVDGKPMSREQGIRLGANVTIGDVSLIVTKM